MNVNIKYQWKYSKKIHMISPPVKLYNFQSLIHKYIEFRTNGF